MKGRGFDRKRARAMVGSGAAISALLAAGILVANALGGKPAGLTASTTVTVPTSGKVTLCHHTGSARNPGVTIRVNWHAWRAHQRRGDTVGACKTTTTTTTTTTMSASHSAPGNSGNAPGHNKQ
jgi:hypothetical protein